MKRTVITVVSILLVNMCFAQLQSAEDYIAKYKDLAIREMKRMGVPAAITLAQGLLETENGNSDLVKNTNNHFGIKCKATWNGDGFSHDDDAKGECFRVYKTAEDSYRDHSNFLRGSDRYAFLFRLNPLEYKEWAHGLKNAGYATNPKYPDILIKNIEQYHLQQYSLQAADDMPQVESEKIENPIADTQNVVAKKDINVNSEEKTILDSPDKLFYVNGLKCINAKKGTSLLVVATKNDISLAKLLEYNDLGEDGILSKDQFIFLQKKSKIGENDSYTSKEGESLYDAAQKNGILMSALLSYNNLSSETPIHAGTLLYLKPLSNVVLQQSQDILKNKSSSLKYYEVQPKDGLYSIAKKSGLTIQQLKTLNNLENDSVKVGQKLIISQ